MSDVVAAHSHSRGNRAHLGESATCGCFYCLAIYPPTEIVEWIDEGQTALCPRCGIDSVLAEGSGCPMSPAFLEKMHARWF
jgi:NAD-dependent SIR2 family protein deacetylase